MLRLQRIGRDACSGVQSNEQDTGLARFHLRLDEAERHVLARALRRTLTLDSHTAGFSLARQSLWLGDAEVDPVHGLAIRAGAQTGEVPTHLFWLRYGPGTRPEDITASHVIEWQNRRYRVLDALDANNAQRFTRVSAKDLGVIRV